MNNIWSYFVRVVNFLQMMQLNCEMCNSSIRVFPHKQNRRAHLSWTSEIPIFVSALSLAALFPAVRVMSLLISPDTGLPFGTGALLPRRLLPRSLPVSVLLLPLNFSPRLWSCFLWRQCVPTLSFQSFGQLAPEINQWPIRLAAVTPTMECR